MATGKSLDIAEIGRRLASQRERLHLDQEEVAERARLSRAYISRLERGIVPNPKVGDLLQVTDALRIPLAELVRPTVTDQAQEIRINECADILAQLEGEPPEVVEDIMLMLRTSVQIAKGRRLARQN